MLQYYFINLIWIPDEFFRSPALVLYETVFIILRVRLEVEKATRIIDSPMKNANQSDA